MLKSAPCAFTKNKYLTPKLSEMTNVFDPFCVSFLRFSLQFYIVVYPNIKKSGLFRTFNGAKQHSSSNTDNILTKLYLVGLQSHTKSHESNKTLLKLMGSYIHNSEYSIIMSFNDKKDNI